MLRKIWRWGVLTIALLFTFGIVGTVFAAETVGGERIVIDAEKTIEDDLFIAGQYVEMNGTVLGDVAASGDTIIINGRVDGNLFVAGQTLILNGDVTGNLFAGGYAAEIGPGANIERNLFFGGYSLIAEPESTIGRSIYAGGYQMALNGVIGRDINFGAVAFEMMGTVAGDMNGEMSIVENGAAVPPTVYGAPAVRNIPPGMNIEAENVGGAIDITETVTTVEPAYPRFGRWAFVVPILGEFIMFMLLGLLVLYFWPQFINRPVAELLDRPLPSLGYGFLVTIVFFLAVPFLLSVIILLAIFFGAITFGQFGFTFFTISGSILGMFTTIFMFILTIMTKIVIAVVVGRLLLNLITRRESEQFAYTAGALFIGVLLYVLFHAVPFLGGAIALVATLMGIGAIYLTMRQRPELKTAPVTGGVPTPQT